MHGFVSARQPGTNDPSEPRLRDELRHTLTLALGTGVSSLLRIAYVVYAARVLGPTAYADLYALLSIVFLFAAGISPIAGTVSRFTSLYLARGDASALAGLRAYARAQLWRIAAALVVAAPVVVVVLRRQLSLDSLLLPALTVAILPLMLFLDLPRGLLRGAQQFASFSINVSVEAVVRLGLSVALLARAAAAESALLAYLLAALLTLPLGEVQVRRLGRGAEPRPADDDTLRRFGGNLFLLAFIGAALQNVDVLVARNVFPDLEAGLYSAASSLTRVVGLVFLPFGIQLLPALTARVADGRRANRTLAAIMSAFGGLALGVVAVLSLAGERILGLLFGVDYVGAQPLIAPLGAALTFTLLTAMLGQAFTARSSFGFLPFYFAVLAAEVGILWWTRSSPETFAAGLLASQLLAFAVVLLCFLATARRRRPTGSAP